MSADLLAGRPRQHHIETESGDSVDLWMRPLTFGDIIESEAMTDDLLRSGFLISRVVCTVDGTRLFASAEDALDQVAAEFLIPIVEEAARRANAGAITPLASRRAD